MPESRIVARCRRQTTRPMFAATLDRPRAQALAEEPPTLVIQTLIFQCWMLYRLEK